MDNNAYKTLVGSINSNLKKMGDLGAGQLVCVKEILKNNLASIFSNDEEILSITTDTIGIKQTYHFNVDNINKYDVILHNIGPCVHFGVVYKVIEDVVYVISISTKNKLDGIEIKHSKMFKDSFYIPYLVPISLESALKTFCFVIDNKLEFNNMVKTMKKNYIKNLL